MNRWNWAKRFQWDEELSEEEVLDLIQYIMEHGLTIFTSHAFERMAERDFTEQDVSNILETGSLASQEFDDRNRNWKYKVQGKTIDDGTAIVVTAVINHRKQLILTVF
jgi:hypothetical protein